MNVEPLHAVLAVVAAVVCALMFFGIEKKKVAHHRKARQIAGKLRELGFTMLPVTLEDYADGDVPGMLRSLEQLHEVLQDPVKRDAEFAKVFDAIVKAKMQDPAQRAALEKLVSDAKAAAGTGFTLAGAAAIGADLVGLAKTGPLQIGQIPDGHTVTVTAPAAAPAPAATATT